MTTEKAQKNTALKAAIAATGKTQVEIAQAAEMPPMYLSMIINRRYIPSGYQVAKLCLALQSTPRKLGLV